MKRGAVVCVLACVLSALGLIFIYSASSYGAELMSGDAYFFVKKQGAAMVVGTFFMFAARYLKPEKLIKPKWIILAVSLILLALVFIPGLGVESYGAKRWLNLGFFTLQPSEYSKFGLVIFIAAYMSTRDMNEWKNIFPVLAAGGATCALIIIEPNMSITVCVGAVMLMLLYVGGVRGGKFLKIALPLLVAVPALIIAEPYRLKRLTAFIDPWENPLDEGYQLIQSYYALGAGGLFGVGIGNSRQKYLFLPFAESDFILSVIGEETGWVGCVVLMILFMLYVYYGLKIASAADTRFKCYLATGITLVVAVQAAVNVAVVSGTIPPTGLPLPFLSAGGSSLVAFMAATGILARCDVKEFSLNKLSAT